VKIAGADPDFHRRDLFEAIDAGATSPSGSSASRLLSQAEADALPYDVLDATKLIPEEVLPDPRGRQA
jgi:catalase